MYEPPQKVTLLTYLGKVGRFGESLRSEFEPFRVTKHVRIQLQSNVLIRVLAKTMSIL